jgi:phosphopantothenoylcysteine decarboxylase
MRALSPSTPTHIFPAMNTLMYEHPLTAEHLRIIKEVIKYNVVDPIGKALACGDICRWFIYSIDEQYFPGIGAMSEWYDIAQIVVDKFDLKLRPGLEERQG